MPDSAPPARATSTTGPAIGELADSLVAFAHDQLAELATNHAPGLILPGSLAGHVVDPDTRADLAYTLGHLHRAGVTEIDGVDVTDATARTMASVFGPATNPFSAYRLAETVLAGGGLDDANPLVGPLDAAARSNLDAACDASGWIPLLDGLLPANYAIVLSRMVRGRRELGLAVDDGAGADLFTRMERLFAGSVVGFIDDSGAGGTQRYDIYSADAHLFAQPFANDLGRRWRDGLRANIDLVERAGTTNGAAFVWGRSTGLLSVCMTIELGALALRLDLTDRAWLWQARIGEALAALDGWFSHGLTTAHQHRSPYGYRGPARRLQLTFDALGKLVAAALELREVSGDGPTTKSRPTLPPHLPVDELIPFTTEGTAGVWTYRDDAIAFVLPLVGAPRSDYLPAPMNPGLFEVPVDSALVTGVPAMWRSDRRHGPAGAPSDVHHEAGTLTVVHEGFPEMPASYDTPSGTELPGTRRATYRVVGRSLEVDERLTFPGPLPHAVTLAVSEPEHRPVHVAVRTDHAHRQTTVDAAGMKEHRSFWGELPRLHQIDFDPAPEIAFTWSLTPKLRIRCTDAHHQYTRELYRHLGARVALAQMPTHNLDDRAAIDTLLERTDQLHLHWPEWFTGPDTRRATRIIDRLIRNEVRIVWTMHNLKPHDIAEGEALYQAWASVADLVLHHSDWGRDQALDRFTFKADARHVVLPHVHWGDALREAGLPDRNEAEELLGLHALPEGTMRLGIVGAPRAEKDVQLALDAFARTTRDDLRLVVFSTDGETVPDDPRIDAQPYGYVPPASYAAQLATLDALLMPFATGMLTTGTVGDAIGLGIPSITSDWAYLTDALGDAAIVYGATADDLTACLDDLDRDALNRAADAAVARQALCSPQSIGRRLGAELDRLGTAKL